MPPYSNADYPVTHTRKEQILNLVELLLKEDTDGPNQHVPQSQTHEKPDESDSQLEITAVRTFKKFQKKITNLEKELHNLTNAIRRVGGSAGTVSAIFLLQHRLSSLSSLYTTNAADLYPGAAFRTSTEPAIALDKRRRRRSGSKTPYLSSESSVHMLDDLESFPDQLTMLADELLNLLGCVNEFPEFSDKAMNVCINSFVNDLKYWFSTLIEYKGQFRDPAVQRYLQDIAADIGEHMDNLTSTLSIFIEVAVPAIRYAQQDNAANLLTLTTIATFVSAVTATTLQFSYQLQGNRLQVALNAFWFSSLVLSTAAALSNVVALIWMQAVFRSPSHTVPLWMLLWINNSGVVLLIISATCFSAGLCLFAYASNQSVVTAAITTALTCVTLTSLGIVSMWILSEQFVYQRYGGSKLVINIPGMTLIWGTNVAKRARTQLYDFVQNAQPWSLWFVSRFDIIHANTRGLISRVSAPFRHSWKVAERNGDDIEAHAESMAEGFSPSNDAESLSSPTLFVTIPPSPLDQFVSRSTGMTRGRVLWQNAIKTARMQSAISIHPAVFPNMPHRQVTGLALSQTRPGNYRRSTVLDEPIRIFSRVKQLQRWTQKLEITQKTLAHQGLILHMQFSPDGRHIATSSWDRTSVIFRVGNPFTSHRVLAHPKGRVSQVAWSPSGKLLVTRVLRAIKVWNEDGVCVVTIERPTDIVSVSWFESSEALLSVEGCEVIKLDLQGQIVDTYNFGSMRLQSVALAPDYTHILAVGTLTLSPSGVKPSKCRAERRLIAYNMDTKTIQTHTPILNDVREISVVATDFRSDAVALISYENNAPPQLWGLEVVGDSDAAVRLVLQRTYRPKAVVDFAGPSYFSGRDQELVVSAGKAGDIYIWHRESGELLRHISSDASEGDLTCIAWNPASSYDFMFATGGHDGLMRVWTQGTDSPSPTLTRSSSYEDSSSTNQSESPTVALGMYGPRASSDFAAAAPALREDNDMN